MNKLMIMALSAVALTAGADVVFDASNRFGDAGDTRNCRIAIEGNVLKVTDIGNDCMVKIPVKSLNIGAYDTLEYRYRANGTGKAVGQFYFWWPGAEATDFRKWVLPAPIADGQWHTVTLSANKSLINPACWFGGGFVSGLRFDPTDAAGGTYELEYIKLKGSKEPAVKPVPEWQGKLDAAVWPDVEPHFYDHASDPACSMRGSFFKGAFISAAGDNLAAKLKSADERYFLRRKFTLKNKPVEAWLQAIGDEEANFTVNGRRALTAKCNTYYVNGATARESVTTFLKSGENVIDVEYKITHRREYGLNRKYAGGITAELFVRYADGSHECIDSDDQWQSSEDGKTWQEVVLSPAPPVPPRAIRFDYCDFANPQRLIAGGPESAEVLAGGRVRLNYEFQGNAPEDTFTVKLQLGKGSSIYWEEELELDQENIDRLTDGRWLLHIDFDAPLYIHSGKYSLTLHSNSIHISAGEHFGGELSIVAVKQIPGWEKARAVEMKQYAGRPEIHIDGRPMPLLWGGVNKGRRPDHRPHHSDMPLTAVTVYNHYMTWHPHLGEYDFASFDLQAEKYRRENPDAEFIWDLTVYPPFEFAKKYPEEMACDGTGDRGSYGRFSWSWASKRGLDEIKEMVTTAIRYLEASPYANRIIGYRVNSGVTIEWLGWDARPGQVKDFSEINRKAFVKFAAERYPELKNPHVPDFAERHELDSANDILWNQQKHLNAIAYMEFNSWIISEDLLEACGTAKATLKSLGRSKLVGTYYGYTYFLNANGNDQRRGHFALQNLLEKNNGRVDFLMSPQSYGQRNFGDTCGDMKPFSTMEMWGIKPVNEDDTRTYNRLYPMWGGFHQTMNARQTRSILQRNGAIALCHTTSPYFYALQTGLDLSSPECAEVGYDLLAAIKFSLAQKVERHAEIALVASEKSVLALPGMAKRSTTNTGYWRQTWGADGKVIRTPERSKPLSGEIFNLGHTRFARAGAPVDYLLAEDLKNHPGDYKVYVFLNALTFDDALLAAVEKLRQRGATLLWLYAPGYLKDNTLASMQKLTGIEFAKCDGPTVIGATMKCDGRHIGTPDTIVEQAFYPVKPDEVLATYASGKPAITRSQVGNSPTYFSGTWQLDVPFIRELERRAKVHVWCDSGDPMEANDSFFTLHARFPGVKTVKLPRKVPAVLDVFNKRVVARDTDTFTFSASLHDSCLFYFGPEAETLLENLE